MLTLAQQQARIAADKTSSAYKRKTGQTTANYPATPVAPKVTTPTVTTPKVTTPVATPAPAPAAASSNIKIGTSDMSPTVATNYLNNLISKNPNASVIVNGKTMSATQALSSVKATPAAPIAAPVTTPTTPTTSTATKLTADQLIDKVFLERKDVTNVQSESWWSSADIAERQKANARIQEIMNSPEQLANYAKTKNIQNVQNYSWWSDNPNKQAAWDLIQGSQAGTPTTPDSTKITDWMDIKTPEDMNTYLNDIQLNSFKKEVEAENTPPTRNMADLTDPETASENLSYFSDLLNPTGEAAPEFSAESKLAELKTKYGTDEMETQIDDLDAQIADLEAATRMQTVDEEGKPVAMGVISGRITEVQRQAQDKLDFLNRQKTTLVNQIQTKYGIIDTIMGAAKLDYDNASAKYQQDFNNNLQKIDLMRGISNDIKTEEDRNRSNAQANWSVIANNIAEGTIDYASATDSQKLLYSKIEMQAGLPAGTLENIAKKTGAAGDGWKFNTLLTAADGTTTSILLTNSAGQYKVQNLDGAYSKFGESGSSPDNIISKSERTLGDTKYLDIVYANGSKTSMPLGKVNGDSNDELDALKKGVMAISQKLTSKQLSFDDAWNTIHTSYPMLSFEQIDTILGGRVNRDNGGEERLGNAQITDEVVRKNLLLQ